MAIRPIYLPGNKEILVKTIGIEFQWFPGLSKTQKQKSIQSLHAAAVQQNIRNILEISSKSLNSLGVQLSAFNLKYSMQDGRLVNIENVFQSSKVFENGGPYLDLLDVSAKEAKTDTRLHSSGRLRGFCLEGVEWPLLPITAFYNWLYLNGLRSSPDQSSQLLMYDGFSDIEFNPNRSLNCQAASVALFVTLVREGEFDSVMENKQAFLTKMNKCERECKTDR